jgi:hypothetical protein
MSVGRGEAGPRGAALPPLEICGGRQESVEEEPHHHDWAQYAGVTRHEALEKRSGRYFGRRFPLSDLPCLETDFVFS